MRFLLSVILLSGCCNHSVFVDRVQRFKDGVMERYRPDDSLEAEVFDLELEQFQYYIDAERSK